MTARHSPQQEYVLKGTTKNEQEVVICKINRNTSRGVYILKPDVPQADYVGEIELLGFRTLPAGLKRSGAGLTSSNGYLILKTLSDTLGTYSLALHASGTTHIARRNGSYHIDFSHPDFRAIQGTLSRIGKEKYEEQQNAVHAHLKGFFPNQFSEPPVDPLLYKSGALSSLLAKRELLKKLSRQDIDELNKFFPEFLRKHGDAAGAQRLIALSKNKRAVEVLYLNRIVKRFEANLKKQWSENKWQKFLSDYILIFNSNYARSLEKESLSLHGSHPDFILIDAYNYLDIYEIKTPRTGLLRWDRSHNNYYWSPDLSKAISQTENYLAHAEQSGVLLKEDVRIRRGFDVRVLKPRGFIIAGTRKQLSNERMQNNFRLLNNSLANVQIVLYDDLLNSLNTFLTRIKRAARKSVFEERCGANEYRTYSELTGRPRGWCPRNLCGLLPSRCSGAKRADRQISG